MRYLFRSEGLEKIRLPYIVPSWKRSKLDRGYLMADLCDDDGANRLATKIQEFWRKRGFEIDVEMKEEGFVSTMRSARTDLRSDMVNGMPTRCVAEAG
jgi:hypothetical protein